MGLNEEEKQATPPPWGWPPTAKEKAHGVEEIVYDRSFHTTHHTKDRRHEQEKLYHKARSGATPDGPAARDAGHGMEPIRQQVRADIAAALRESPQHPVRNLAEGVQARRGLPDHPARQPLARRTRGAIHRPLVRGLGGKTHRRRRGETRGGALRLFHALRLPARKAGYDLHVDARTQPQIQPGMKEGFL